jgi:hypothetical protein
MSASPWRAATAAGCHPCSVCVADHDASVTRGVGVIAAPIGIAISVVTVDIGTIASPAMVLPPPWWEP